MSKAKDADLILKLYDLRREADHARSPQLVFHVQSPEHKRFYGCINQR